LFAHITPVSPAATPVAD